MQEIKFSSPSVDAEFVLYQIPEPVQGTIVKRPSQHCKTPYMADAIIHVGYGRPLFAWAGHGLVQPDAQRAGYLRALRQADAGNIGPLLAFARP